MKTVPITVNAAGVTATLEVSEDELITRHAAVERELQRPQSKELREALGRELLRTDAMLAAARERLL